MSGGFRVGHSYLGGVEVDVVVLLVSRQILVFVVRGGPHQHHPVAVFFAAGVEAHHHAVPLEDLVQESTRKNRHMRPVYNRTER